MAGKSIFTSIFLLLTAAPAAAKELYGPEAGVVPFGMGRAYSAVADDWLALHYNPAGLALVDKVSFQAFDIRMGSNRDVVTSFKDVKNLGDDTGSLANTLNNYTGKHIMAEASNNTQITVPHFALGVGYNAHLSLDMQNRAYPTTLMRYTKDFNFSLGGAIAAGKRKDLRIGLRMSLINRRGSVREVGVDEIVGSRASLLDKFSSAGSGISGTLGIQYRLPTKGRTEFTTSFVWHDMGRTTFGGREIANRPTPIEDNMVAGFAVRLPIGGKQNRRLERRYGPKRSTSHLTFAADYSHLNYGLDREHFPKHIHLGMNLDLPLLSLQAGLNQTSLTFGTSFDIGIIRVAAATYAEELGSYAGQRRDRRYLISVGSALGFKGF